MRWDTRILEIVKTIREQAGRLIHVSNLYYHEYQGALAEKLCTLAGGSSGDGPSGEKFRAFFQNSGTEAIGRFDQTGATGGASNRGRVQVATGRARGVVSRTNIWSVNRSPGKRSIARDLSRCWKR